MPSDFVAVDGTTKSFDLDNVYEIVRGFSGMRRGWTSLVVYEPTHGAFIELRSSPPDIRGNSKDEAEEVLPTYIEKSYGLSKAEINLARAKPNEWRLVNLR